MPTVVVIMHGSRCNVGSRTNMLLTYYELLKSGFSEAPLHCLGVKEQILYQNEEGWKLLFFAFFRDRLPHEEAL